jgi:uncharacterized membrane-anchored protein
MIWSSFSLLVLLQWWTPAAMIWNREEVLKTGRTFKFRSAPVDPGDPFRGKYITLRFNNSVYKNVEKTAWKAGETVYIQIIKDSAGYAKIHSLHKNKPGGETDFIKSTINYLSYDSAKNVFVNWPFERFYLEESKAHGAEQAYLRSTGDSNSVTYAVVKIKKGTAVLENVFINEKPIVYYIKK